MKTKKQLLFILILLMCGFTHAQNVRHSLEATLKDINVVVLNLEGHVKIDTLTTSQIKSTAVLHTKGDVWGFSFPEKRPEFKIESSQSGDTLYVTTPPKFSYSSIGVSTYHEEIETLFQISTSVKLIIKSADQVEINSGWSYLNVMNANQVNIQGLNHSEINTLNCEGKESLIVNGFNKPKIYEFQGVGTASYFLKANNIKLTF